AGEPPARSPAGSCPPLGRGRLDPPPPPASLVDSSDLPGRDARPILGLALGPPRPPARLRGSESGRNGLMALAAALGLCGVLFCLFDWRRGLLLCIAVGFLQDPLRKIVPGQPVA